MSSILSARKRSLKLRSRLKRSLQKNATNEFVNQLQCDKIILEFAPDKWCRIVDHFLTEKDCTSFINFLHKNSPNQLKARASTKVKKGSSNSKVYVPQPRGLTWTINRSELISTLIFERCFNFLPKTWIDETDGTIWEISGINDDIKSLSYRPGDTLCPHYDTPYVKSSKEKSFITVVLYLNHDFVGGKFQFRDPFIKHALYTIDIQSGTCLLFQHNTFHQATPIQQGTKYMIRFDVLYRQILHDLFNKNRTKGIETCIWL
eukprot:469506_1